MLVPASCPPFPYPASPSRACGRPCWCLMRRNEPRCHCLSASIFAGPVLGVGAKMQLFPSLNRVASRMSHPSLGFSLLLRVALTEFLLTAKRVQPVLVHLVFNLASPPPLSFVCHL